MIILLKAEAYNYDNKKSNSEYLFYDRYNNYSWSELKCG